MLDFFRIEPWTDGRANRHRLENYNLDTLGWTFFLSKELDDEDFEDFVKEELSLEKAKILFDKRVGAAIYDDDDLSDEEDEIQEIIKSKKGTFSGSSLGI